MLTPRRLFHAETIARETIRSVRVLPVAGDMIRCDDCTLAPSCDRNRTGGDCTVTDSKGKALATVREMYLPGDPRTLLDSLGQVLNMQADRLSALMEHEKSLTGEDQAEARAKVGERIDKGLNNLFKNGMALYKHAGAGTAPPRDKGGAVGPSRAGGPAGEVGSVARVIRELETDHGIDRDEITPAMVRAYQDGGISAVRRARATGIDERGEADARDIF